MNFAIIDNDDQFLNLFCEQYRKIFKIDNLKSFSNCQAFLKSLNNYNYDAIFLDVELPDMNGLELASFLNENLPDIIIIFISDYLKYAIDGYKFKAFRFVHKLRINEELSRLFSDLQDELRRNRDINKIVLTYKDYTYNISINEIIYCISEGHYLTIECINNRIYRIRIDLIEIKNKLLSEGFIEIYRGTLINSLYVEKISLKEKLIFLNNDKKLHGSKKGIRKLKGALNEIR